MAGGGSTPPHKQDDLVSCCITSPPPRRKLYTLFKRAHVLNVGVDHVSSRKDKPLGILWCSDSTKKRLRILCVRALEKAALMFLTSSWPPELLAFQVDYMLGDNPRATGYMVGFEGATNNYTIEDP
ncbi:hypothetical protein M8C21_026615 [Ambrosia artemisiifolia]|uniref:Uncharacterized protein n=1 Tax=Ambrosia artemisiifolia TaxID=4212 RepID=A0AAD5BLS6_AMBAR|nr:hypothetical protein M8C21_026615 [Ambrosia artemisiifolia]